MKFRPDERPTSANDPATQRLTEDLHQLYNQPQPPRHLQNWSPSRATHRQAQPVSLAGRSKKWQKEENALPESNNGSSKPWITLAGIAACLVLALGLVALITLGTGKTGNPAQPGSGSLAIATQTPIPTPTLIPDDTAPSYFGGFTLGGLSPKVNIEMYVDYQCPACRTWNTTSLQKLLDEYINNGKNVSFSVRFYPFLDSGQSGQESHRLVEGAYCAAEQRHFWEYNSAVYAIQPGRENTGFWTIARLKDLGKSIKLDSSKFDSCLDTGRYKNEVVNEVAAAQKRGISATPAFLVNNQPVALSGPTDYASLKTAIDAAFNSPDYTPLPEPTAVPGAIEPTPTMIPLPGQIVNNINCKGLDSLSCAFKSSKYSQVTEKNMGQTLNMVQEFQDFQVTLKRVYVGPDETGNNPALVLGYTINAPTTMNSLVSFHPHALVLKDSQGHVLTAAGGSDGPALFNEQGYVVFWQLPPNLKGTQKLHLEIINIGPDHGGQATVIEPVTVVPDLPIPTPFPPTALKGGNAGAPVPVVPPTPTAVPGSNEQPGNTGPSNPNRPDNQTGSSILPTPTPLPFGINLPPTPTLVLPSSLEAHVFSFDFEVDFK